MKPIIFQLLLPIVTEKNIFFLRNLPQDYRNTPNSGSFFPSCRYFLLIMTNKKDWWKLNFPVFFYYIRWIRQMH